MRLKLLSSIGAFAALAAAPAFGITVNISGFVYPDAPTLTLNGGPAGSPSAALAGQFMGTLTDDTTVILGGQSILGSNNLDASTTSFTAWCTELSQEFNFNTNYQYEQDSGASYYSGTTLTALSRLFTAAQGFVVNSATAAAMQAGIWEVLYEHSGSYDVGSGSFSVGASDQATLNAFVTINSYLSHLSSYNASYQINVLGSDTNQDFLVPTIPEPSTWALLLGGLGAIGYLSRRRRDTSGARLTATV